MQAAPNKTKIVCTIGPASESVEVIERLLKAGMNVARLNFSHGDFSGHQKVIENIRRASKNTGIRAAIMADLPGPKMRIGLLEQEPIELIDGEEIILTTDDITGNQQRVSVSFQKLPAVVKPGDKLFINDGLRHLKVVSVEEGLTGARLRTGSGCVGAKI